MRLVPFLCLWAALFLLTLLFLTGCDRVRPSMGPSPVCPSTCHAGGEKADFVERADLP